MVDPLTPSTDDLKVFLAVERTGRMTTAGAALGLDYTTVSRRVRRLEESLGVTLLVRSSDGWETTHIGKRIAERAAPLEQVSREIRELAMGDDGTVRGSVRISAPEGFAVTFVSRAISRVLRDHPGISCEVVTATRPVSSRGSGYDMVVSIGLPLTRHLHTEALTRYDLGLYQSLEHREIHKPIETVADLRDHLLIFYVDGLLSVAELDLMHSFSGTRVGFGSTSVMAQLEATLGGGGVGLLPCFLAERQPSLVPVLRDEVRFELSYSLSIRPNSKELEAVAVVRDALRKEVAERRSELYPA